MRFGKIVKGKRTHRDMAVDNEGDAERALKEWCGRAQQGRPRCAVTMALEHVPRLLPHNQARSSMRRVKPRLGESVIGFEDRRSERSTWRGGLRCMGRMR
jgi:hypothetical protein